MSLISPQTRTAFREAFVRQSVLRQIRDWFDSAGVTLGSVPADQLHSGERRQLVERYYAGVNWDLHRDTRKVLDVYEQLLAECWDEDEEAKLTRLLQRDGFSYKDGAIYSGNGLDPDALKDAAEPLDVRHVQPHIRRIMESVETDPDQAIGSSKELLESVAKAVLTEHGEDPSQFSKFPQLVKAALKALDLSTESIPSASKGAKSMMRALSGMSQIVDSVAELRNLYGTGHGKLADERGIGPRHARLVAGSATTLATFMLETLHTRRAKAQTQRST
ncbi:MAG: hypothetical protein CMM84_12680 [Rhodothermaceae bacterium]|nr:hypothetical protein [Rhodothermaceae bacterium]MBC11634.1 hypothetical protein [Rhodothermaceae bacterium]